MPELTISKKIPGLSKVPLMPGHQVGGVPAKPLPAKELGPVGKFLERNYRHYNAACVIEAAEAYCKLIDEGGKMFVAMAGAMSTAEIGISLAEMIRQDKVHAICCTGANLEEDLFNCVAHSKYLRIPSWTDLTPEDDEALLEANLPRVTDTSIPEKDAMNVVEKVIRGYWKKADKAGESHFPHEYLYMAIRDHCFDDDYEIDPKDSWLIAACEKDLPIIVPGWEDSTLGNIFAAWCLKGEISDSHVVRGGIEYMMALADWYLENAKGAGIGFFQMGGGIAGDMPICVVPMLRVDMQLEEKAPHWAYFCQVTESSPSMGGYSGAVPNEKITWDKLSLDTPRFSVEGDCTIIVPLIFAYALGQ